MSDKDFIKDLFQEQLGNLEAPVNPDLWSGIQSQLGNAAASGVTVATKGAVITKFVVAVSILAAGVAGTIYVTSNEKPNQQEIGIVQNDETPQEVIPSEEPIVEGVEIIVPSEEEAAPPHYPLGIDDREIEQTRNQGGDTYQAQMIPTDLGSGTAVPKADDGNSSKSNTDDGAEKISPNQEVKSEPLIAAITAERRDNQHYRFSAESNGKNLKYSWDFGDGNTSHQMSPEHFFSKGGNYQVSLTVIDGERTKSVIHSLEVKTLGRFIKLPTIITPNNDGSNDEFFVESEGLAELTIVVMDQKNEIVFESNAIDFRWDGRDRRTGLVVDKGNYYYMISAIDDAGNQLNKHNRLAVDY